MARKAAPAPKPATHFEQIPLADAKQAVGKKRKTASAPVGRRTGAR